MLTLPLGTGLYCHLLSSRCYGTVSNPTPVYISSQILLQALPKKQNTQRKDCLPSVCSEV